jgi:orotate phosphoribosyltransferase
MLILRPEAGAIVTRFVLTIDREQGARQNVEQAGYAFEALLAKEDLGIP